MTCTRHSNILLAAVLGVTLSSCSSTKTAEEKPEQPSTQTAEEETEQPATQEASAQVDYPPCEAEILWPATLGSEAFVEAYCAQCGETGEQANDETNENSCDEPRWPVLAPPEDWYFACVEYDYAIQAIRLWHGQPVDEDWQAYLSEQPWYQDFPERELSSEARDNLALFEKKLDECRTSTGWKPAHRELVADWFQRREQTGQVPTEGVLLVDGRPASAEEFAKFIDQHGEGYFEYSRRTPITAGTLEADWVQEHIPQARTALFVPTRLVGRLTSEHEGYESITFYLDENDDLVGMHVTAAACPHVYTKSPLGWQYQGEVLRHQHHRFLSKQQSLTLAAADNGASCAGPVELRIAEEKEEVTYLDSVWLDIDGRRIKPASCQSANAPAYCKSDGEYVVLEQGEHVDVTFEPSVSMGQNSLGQNTLGQNTLGGKSCRRMKLQAVGYYAYP